MLHDNIPMYSFIDCTHLPLYTILSLASWWTNISLSRVKIEPWTEPGPDVTEVGEEVKEARGGRGGDLTTHQVLHQQSQSQELERGSVAGQQIPAASVESPAHQCLWHGLPSVVCVQGRDGC